MAPAPADHQTGLDRVGNDDNRAAFVQQLVGDALFGDVLDFIEHTHRIAGALVFLWSGHRLGGQQQAGGDQQYKAEAAHGWAPEVDHTR
jgi:hypothetical protein